MAQLSEEQRELLSDWINDNWTKLTFDYGTELCGVAITNESGGTMVVHNSAMALLVNPETVTRVVPVFSDPAEPGAFRFG